MADSNEGLGWWAVAQRALLWGVVMALKWGWFPFLFGGGEGLLWWFSPHSLVPSADVAADGDIGDNFLPLGCIFSTILTCLWTMGGALTGWVLGDIAPNGESLNPFNSEYFRLVGRWTFWPWFWLNYVGGFFCLLLTGFSPELAIEIFALFSTAMWVYCLRRALNRARSEGFRDAFTE